MPPTIDYTQVIVSFLMVIGLIGLFAWGLKRYASAGGMMAKMRSDSRLKRIDTLPIDARTKVVLFACDGQEYLVMVSGEKCEVVEKLAGGKDEE